MESLAFRSEIADRRCNEKSLGSSEAHVSTRLHALACRLKASNVNGFSRSLVARGGQRSAQLQGLRLILAGLEPAV